MTAYNSLIESIKKIYKRKEQGSVFAITIEGNLYFGNRPDTLDRLDSIKPIVLIAKDYESADDFITAIKTAISNCISELEKVDRLSNSLLYRRYNACLDIEDLLEGRIDYV